MKAAAPLYSLLAVSHGLCCGRALAPGTTSTGA